MLKMLRGTKTTIYLSDLMRRVGAASATFTVNARGEPVVDFVLPGGKTKRQVMPRSAKVVDDVTNQERK